MGGLHLCTSPIRLSLSQQPNSQQCVFRFVTLVLQFRVIKARLKTSQSKEAQLRFDLVKLSVRVQEVEEQLHEQVSEGEGEDGMGWRVHAA